jgi:DNA-binding protein YbaB
MPGSGSSGRGRGRPEELRFEVEDDYDESPRRRAPRPIVEEPVDEDGVSRKDPAGLVTVRVDAAGGVKSVKLADQWQRSVAPQALHVNVLQAANAAIMAALAQEGSNTAPLPWAATTHAPVARAEAKPQPRSPQDRFAGSVEVVRLVNTVVAELAQFDQKLGAARAHPASVQSRGQHVRVAADNVRILGVSIDPGWLGSTRDPEIESELVDALVQAQSQASLGSLAQGPQSPAISEMMSLVSNPAELLRRLGLTSD